MDEFGFKKSNSSFLFMNKPVCQYAIYQTNGGIYFKEQKKEQGCGTIELQWLKSEIPLFKNGGIDLIKSKKVQL